MIDFRDNLEEVFGKGDPNDLVMNFFKEQLPTDILDNTTFNNVRVFDSIENHQNIQSIQYDSRHVGIYVFPARNRVNVRVPLDGTKFEFVGYEPEYVLLVDNLRIETEYVDYGVSAKYLYYISDFVLWDNENGNLVSHGHVEQYGSVFYPVITIDIGTFTAASKNYARAIFTESPFTNIKRRYW
jgi:hypothetical protein